MLQKRTENVQTMSGLNNRNKVSNSSYKQLKLSWSCNNFEQSLSFIIQFVANNFFQFQPNIQNWSHAAQQLFALYQVVHLTIP